MNRIGIAVVLTVAIVVGVVFGVYPKADLAISALFYDTRTHLFLIGLHTWVLRSRDAARWLVAVIAAPAFLAILGKLILPRRRMLIEGRAALLIVVTLGLGPGLVANTIFKDHWGRSRPMDVAPFGGADRFTAWWDPSGPCPNNCSFIAGEPSGAFWTLAPAVFAPPQWRLAAYGGALVFGIAVGALRIVGGGHFFTDVVFAGIFMFLVVWTMHGLIFRWRATRMAEDAVERPLAEMGEAMRDAVASWLRRIRGRDRKGL
jgi:membrane-associated PAP2 superfamily phosphatase